MSDYIMVSSPTVQSDLVTKTDYVVYIPLATKETHGSVKIGEGLKVSNGEVSFDDSLLNNKLDIFRGVDDANKVLYVNTEGLIDFIHVTDLLPSIQFDDTTQFPIYGDDKQLYVDLSDNSLYIYNNGNYTKVNTPLTISSLNWSDGAQKVSNVSFGRDFEIYVTDGDASVNLSEPFRFELNKCYAAVDYDVGTGVLTFTRKNGLKTVIDLPLELLVKSGYYDEFTQSLILVLANDEVISIPVDALVKDVYSKEETNELLTSKQNVLTAGRGIEITEENVINMSIDDTISDISTNPVQNRVLYQIFEAQEERFSQLLDEFDYNKQDKLTAGENITIDENNVISSTGGGGGLSIADLPKFVNKIYINMANRTALAGELTLNCVESSNFVVDWGDGSLTEYADATTTLSHTYTDTNFAGWIYIYGNWNGIAYDSDSSARAYVIEQVIYDNNITNIPKNAFRFAKKLTSVKLPNSVLRIEDQAFYYSGLVDVELPSNLEYLGSSALGNTKIYRIVIPASAAVGESAVSLADNLTEIEIAEGRTNFNNMYYMLRGNHTVKFLKIPNSITSFYFVLTTGYSDVETVEFIRSTPPTISSTAGIFDTQKTIIVPYASLKQYKSQTNLTTYANKIYPKGGNYSETITIPSTAWDTATNTATVEAVGATSEARNVITWFTSNGGSQVENTHGLKCTAQGTMQLTFSCETIPTEDVEVSVSYMLTNY